MLKVAFYEGIYGGVSDWLIMLRTLGAYSHVELVFSDGVSFSSSAADGGVRFKNIDYSDEYRWTFIPLNVTKEVESIIRETCNKEVGKPYDWVGILFDQLFKFNTQDNNAWWCSELIGYVLGYKRYRVSPSTLFRMVNSDK
jgi:uncharacterized protein YycO